MSASSHPLTDRSAIDSMVTGLRRENDLLIRKLARLGRATQGLASELAATRRACRDQERQIVSLRAEIESLLAGGRP